ncbi:hypothetical protein H0H81_011752 [Sphagnurus paluster]|uniref:ATP-dependent RNA helicase n=1 Tax=Sphagnurus paluster TaxID=117069 RepID=A0A9P7KI73_9AGAR|nr:hypothetical protein H0H81_011752 [Sphagnurus paluster]
MPSTDIPRKSGVKRKVPSKALSSRKKIKGRPALDTVSRPSEADIGGNDGILELEVWKLSMEQWKAIVDDAGSEVDEKGKGIEDKIEHSTSTANDVDEPIVVEDLPPFDSESLLPEWYKYTLHPKIKMALHEKGFLTPTAIQAASLPFALADRDVVGGSGKTLAYGLPILHYLLSQPRPSSSRKRPLRALDLAATRELALQVLSHLNSLLTSNEFSNNAKASNAKDNSKLSSSSQAAAVRKPPPHVSIAAIVGGMSSHKQRCVLDRGVDVLVATPGRLWDILEDDDELALEIRNLRFLVLDAADRMIEAGHFSELANILRLTIQEAQ